MTKRMSRFFQAFIVGCMMALAFSIVQAAPTALAISNISTNAATYTGNAIPQYEKFEITFSVLNSVAENMQFPYDANPPSGVDLNDARFNGINVDGLFLPPGESNWADAYRQPGFHFAEYDEAIKKSWDFADHEWFYPTGNYVWKVRFAPNQIGTWQFRLEATDASGTAQSTAQSFTVAASNNKGFIKVSESDPRYFEFDDGSPFFGLGFKQVANLDKPILKNSAEFQTYKDNNINFLRIWTTSVFGSSWLHWMGGRDIYDGYLPRAGLLPFYDAQTDRTTLTQRIDIEPEGNVGWFDACRFDRWNDPAPLKQNTDYRIQIKYRGVDIVGPADNGNPTYGFVTKFGGWILNCHEVGVGTVVTNYGGNNAGWGVIEGTWNSGTNNFLPRLYMALENTTSGKVYVDSVAVQEVLGNGQYGPNVVVEPSMQYDSYFAEQSLIAMDKMLEQAEANDIYIKLVLQEKADRIYVKLNDDGSYVTSGPDNADGFYGVGRTVNRTRWIQQAWWRYAQARWGYSTSIHSWELTNEGNPGSPDHWEMTDEMGKYLHCRTFGVAVAATTGAKCNYDHPNDHLVTTSFWHSFPDRDFWVNAAYDNVDYADVHAYISTGWLNNPAYESDSALFHLDYAKALRDSIDYWSGQNGVTTEPVVRGETGIDTLDVQNEQADLTQDNEGIWLHNLIWPSISPYALYEMPFWTERINSEPGFDGQSGLYEHYRNLGAFIDLFELNNGEFVALSAESTSTLRITGQHDRTNGTAYAWIQNKQHTWRNVVDGVTITPLNTSIALDGFAPNSSYQVSWWNPYEATIANAVTSVVSISADAGGTLTLPIINLSKDIAVKIDGPPSSPPDPDTCTDAARVVDWSTQDQGTLYKSADATLGTSIHTDRDYFITQLSSGLQGGTLIQTANDDKRLTISDHLDIEVCGPATVYVFYDHRATTLPNWLQSWETAGETLTSTDANGSPLIGYKTSVAQRGELVLGGNMQGDAAGALTGYTIIVVAQSVPTAVSLTTFAASEAVGTFLPILIVCVIGIVAVGYWGLQID